MTQTNRVSVSILGDRFTIRGEAEADYIAEVADLVDRRMRSLREGSPSISKNRLAVLTAINLADELLQERQGKSDEEVEKRTRQLITLLDEGLVGDLPD